MSSSSNPLKDQLMEDMKNYMKSKETSKLGYVRMLLSEVKNVEINNRESFKPDMAIKAVAAYVKKLQKSLEDYKNVPDKLKLIEEEIEFCQHYLPQGLSQAELKSIMMEVISQHPGEKNFGILMKAAMQKTQGKADGAAINNMLKELLA